MPHESDDRRGLQAAIEALLFVAPDGASVSRLLAGTSAESESRILDALQKLAEDLEARDSALQIVRTEDIFRLATRSEHDGIVKEFLREERKVSLSKAALETLAIVAYRQPITTPEVDQIRGVGSIGIVKTLANKGYVSILGRRNVIGRPLVFGTTEKFLLEFGLRDLSALPTLDDFNVGAPMETGNGRQND